MNVLVNFEDTYGIADIACKYFFNDYIEPAYNEKAYGDVLIRRALSTANIFRYRTIPKDISIIIYVYDMDKQKMSSPYNILEPEDLKEKIDILADCYGSIELKFVPVAFSAETICLHMLQTETMDYSKVFSEENTAHLHTKILSDILSGIHPDKDDRTYWSMHGQQKMTFNTKRTRVYMEDLQAADCVYQLLQQMKYSNMNQCLFEWICGKKIDDTTRLLTAEQAIELQKEYKSAYDRFLYDHEKTIEIDNKIYRLDYNYKE